MKRYLIYLVGIAIGVGLILHTYKVDKTVEEAVEEKREYLLTHINKSGETIYERRGSKEELITIAELLQTNFRDTIEQVIIIDMNDTSLVYRGKKRKEKWSPPTRDMLQNDYEDQR